MSGCGCEQCERAPMPNLVANDDGTVIPEEIRARIQSPIEWAFLDAFLARPAAAFGQQDRAAFEVSGDRLMRGAFWIQPQARVGPFMADFVVGRSFEGLSCDVAVELDGHEFHAKTAEQVENDRKRDRAFVRLGAVVLRFTGREVTRDPRACVDEVQALLTSWLTKAMRRRT